MDSKNESSIEVPSVAPVSTPRNFNAVSIGTPVVNNMRTSASTPQPSVASSTTPFFTPPMSKMFEFSAGVSKLPSESKDIPVPSIELTGGLPVGSGGEATPRTLPAPAPYYGSLDAQKETSQGPSELGVAAFVFGGSKEESPFTFRMMHNATPEPSQTSEHGRYSSGAAGLVGEPEIQELANKLASSDLTGTSASMSDRSGESNIKPGSNAIRGRKQHSRYEVKDERPPNEPYFNKQFQEALQKGKQIAGRIKATLQTCELAEDQESHVYGMIESANELHSFDAPAVCTIGIVGDSGVGKSSLINSLLDEPDLARTAGLGRACTSVVTEYRNRKREHTAEYTVEVDCMTEDEIDEQLGELLWSYRQFYLYDLDDKGVTVDEQKHLQEQSKVAWDTLQAAFGSEGALSEEYLQNSSDGAEVSIKAQLKVWTKQLQWPAEIEKGGWLGTAVTVEDCNTKTQRFLSGNLWPFVKVIRIFLSSQILKSGVILADLPGFHDSNQARVKAAEAYMYNCDEIFVVAEIGRVNTNQNVEMILQQNLGNNLKSGRPSQGIALVCTKSEDLDEDEIKKTFFKKGQASQADKVEDLEKKIDDAQANPTEAGALVKRDQAQDELNYLYMTARNEYISKIVRETCAKRFPNRTLSIFCVSNKEYKKNRKRIGPHDVPMKGSGIPALRSYCHKIPARAQFRIANHFFDIMLKDLVQRVQLWLTGASQKTMPNDKTVAKLMNALQINLQKNISDYFLAAAERQERTANDVIFKPMSQKSGKWTEGALAASAMWSSYHHTQIAGFCRNYGNFSSLKVTYTEWNLELIEEMVDDMYPWWDHLSESFEQTIDYINDAVNVDVEKLAAEVKDFHGAPFFAEAIETKLQSVAYHCSDIKGELRRRLDSIKHNTTGNHRGAYVYEEMLPAYRNCAMDSGTGVTERRLRCLKQAIGSPRETVLFTGIQNRLMKALEAVGRETYNNLREEMTQMLKQVSNDIEMLRGTEAQMLAKNGDFLERLSRVIAEMETEMMRIAEMTAAVKAEAESNGYF